MKWLIGFLFIITTFNIAAQTKIESIRQMPIKIKRIGEETQKGFLMDIDQTMVTFFTNKKHLKQNLLDGCQSCQKVALTEVETLIMSSTKQRTGKIVGGAIAFLFTTIAVLGSQGDMSDVTSLVGVYGAFYAGGGIGIGAIIDGAANNSQKNRLKHYPKTRLITNREMKTHALPFFIDYSPLAQFERLQQKQRLTLQEILNEIQSNPLIHQQRFSFFSKDSPVMSGYLIGQDETHLFLANRPFSRIEDKDKVLTDVKKVKLTTLLYYQIAE